MASFCVLLTIPEHIIMLHVRPPSFQLLTMSQEFQYGSNRRSDNFLLLCLQGDREVTVALLSQRMDPCVHAVCRGPCTASGLHTRIHMVRQTEVQLLLGHLEYCKIKKKKVFHNHSKIVNYSPICLFFNMLYGMCLQKLYYIKTIFRICIAIVRVSRNQDVHSLSKAELVSSDA